jgi:hypothetical protein
VIVVKITNLDQLGRLRELLPSTTFVGSIFRHGSNPDQDVTELNPIALSLLATALPFRITIHRGFRVTYGGFLCIMPTDERPNVISFGTLENAVLELTNNN